LSGLKGEIPRCWISSIQYVEVAGQTKAATRASILRRILEQKSRTD
jgi:hypothetical protein